MNSRTLILPFFTGALAWWFGNVHPLLALAFKWIVYSSDLVVKRLSAYAFKFDQMPVGFSTSSGNKFSSSV